MMIVPVAALPSQTLNVTLGGQRCTLNLYQKGPSLYLDLYIAGRPLATTVLCRDRVRLVRYAYLGFVGELVFIDAQGQSDPTYAQLGSRFMLVYYAGDEL